MTRWTERDVPDLTGRRAIVTGGSSGIGREVARGLAAHGAEVTITSRDAERADAALCALRAALPAARIDARLLDLADLGSVRAFAAAEAARGPLDLLINNAGVMALRRRMLTRDGFEMQFGTNHLGHFALTGLLLDALSASRVCARVVSVASIAHRRGRIALDDLQAERRYDPPAVYAQSKLANLMFALELQRRLTAHGARLISVAAHPGVARTNIVEPMLAGRHAMIGAVVRGGFGLLAQSAAQGALPILRAATDPSAQGGQYFGPDGMLEMRGYPALAAMSDAARDEQVAASLWQRSESLTGVAYLD